MKALFQESFITHDRFVFSKVKSQSGTDSIHVLCVRAAVVLAHVVKIQGDLTLESQSGLGLISMRERLRLVGGSISIHSTSRGTTIDVTVPVSGLDIRSEAIDLPGSGKLSYLPPLSVSA